MLNYLREISRTGATIELLCGEPDCNLQDNDIHLWLFPLDLPLSISEELASALSADERHRANRYYAGNLKREHECCRGMLRFLLGFYSRVAPGSVYFEYGAAGKPFVAWPVGMPNLEFSVSHSGGWALIGLTRGGCIGVDLEAIREVPEYADIARSSFVPGEADTLLQLPGSMQLEAFFVSWTRKEALLKAQGDGLSIGLDRFDVSTKSDAPGTFIPVSARGTCSPLWQLHSFKPLQHFWAAVAVSFSDPCLRTFRPGFDQGCR